MLYCFLADGGEEYVEAENIEAALGVWREFHESERDAEPAAITVVTTDKVVRAASVREAR